MQLLLLLMAVMLVRLVLLLVLHRGGSRLGLVLNVGGVQPSVEWVVGQGMFSRVVRRLRRRRRLPPTARGCPSRWSRCGGCCRRRCAPLVGAVAHLVGQAGQLCGRGVLLLAVVVGEAADAGGKDLHAGAAAAASGRHFDLSI